MAVAKTRMVSTTRPPATPAMMTKKLPSWEEEVGGLEQEVGLEEEPAIEKKRGSAYRLCRGSYI